MESREAQIINKRLDNMDDKLEKLVAVVTTQVQIIKQLDDHESRLRRLESTVRQNSFVASGALKFTGWLVAGAISLGFFFLKG